MQLTLSGHHIDLTDSLREYVDEKLAKVIRHFDSVLDVNVILTVEKLQHKAEATLNISGGNIYADDTQGDMYAAIDGLVVKLDRQVIKHKEKSTNHHRNNNEGAHRNFDAETSS